LITLNSNACINCLKCKHVCPNYVFSVIPKPDSGQELYIRFPDQCCACGHCIAVCPSDALSHPALPRGEFISLPPSGITPEQMQRLLFSRRSVRNYRPDPISDEVIGELLAAATHAGTSSNGQTEGFIVIKDRARLKGLELLVVDVLWRAGLKHMGGDGMLGRLLEKKYGPELVRQYRPYHDIFQHRRNNGEIEGVVFRNAPLVIVAHGLKANLLAAANCALALRNIELLALTMGLGTCWIGFLVGAAARSKKIGNCIGMTANRRIWGALMVGYPEEQYNCKLPRKSRDVRWI
jgi:nitroreductase/NAD-dependent dihydropyrimidine dehydrogenase PreA subunit